MNQPAHELTHIMRSLERSFLIGVEGVTEVLLVRHADVYDNLAQPDDPPLSARGRDEARHLAERLRRLAVAAVYASPYRRALETAYAFSDRVMADPRLVETQANFTDGTISVEEPPASVVARMQAAINDAVAAHTGQRIVMVTHGLAILGYLCDILRLTPGSLRLFPAPTSISVVRIKDERRMAGALCDVAHLEGMG